MDGRVRGILFGVCLMAALALASTAYAASATDSDGRDHISGNDVYVTGTGNFVFNGAVSGEDVTVNLTNGNSAVFNNTVQADVFMKIDGTGSTTFEQAITIGDSSNPIPFEDHDLYITGGTNTFKSTVTAGSLGTDILGSKTNIINVFKDQVTLWGSDFEGLPGYAVILGSGTNTFEKQVTTTDKSALFMNTVTTFNDTLDVGNGRIIIGYNNDVVNYSSATAAEKQSLFNTTAEVILATNNSELLSSEVYVGKGGTLTVQANARISGRLRMREGGVITTAANTTLSLENGLSFYDAQGTFNGKVVNTSVDRDISINGNSNIKFLDTVTTAAGLEIMDGAAQTEFHKAVEASCLAVDTVQGKGPSTNIFKDDVTLTGYDSDIVGAKQFSLVLADGINSFEKTVTTGNKSAGFLSSTTTFNGHLNAGTGDVELGWSPMVDAQPDDDEMGFPPEQYQKKQGTVILASKNGSTPSITANSVSVYNHGNLQLESDATINGDVNFSAGGVLTTDAKYLLTVNGNATIEEGALANIRNAGSLDAIGKTIMTASAIDGAFNPYAASLYKVATEGNSVVITGLNKVEDVLEELNIATGNSAAAAAMTSQVLNDASVSLEIQENLANNIQAITALAATDPHLAEVATRQFFGENVLSATTATQSTASSFATGINNHQVQLRDQASAASTTAGDGYASINPRYYRHNDTANRIWAAGFGSWAKQRNRDNQFGYKYDSGGFILGYDRQHGDFVFGVSGAYSNGDIKDNDGLTKTDIDTLNVGLYGSYNPACGLFVDASVGFGWAWNDFNENAVVGGSKKGKYRNTSFQMGGNVGYTFNLGSAFRFVPTVGVQYTHVHQKAWDQTVSAGSGLNALHFDSTNNDYVSIPVAVRVNRTFDLGNGVRITPELRASYIYEAKKNQPKVRMGYVGTNYSTTLYGMDSGRSRALVGAGVKAKLSRNLDVFVDYNFAFRKKYTSHNVMAGLGLSF